MEALLRRFTKRGPAEVPPPSGRIMRRFQEFKKQVSPDDITRVAGKLSPLLGSFTKPVVADVPPPSGRIMRRFQEFKKQVSPEDITRVAGKLGSMNRGPVTEIWSKVQSLWTFIRESDAGWDKKAMALASLVYLVSPLDAVPDFIPGLGLVDDVSVILLVFGMLAGLVQQHMVKLSEEKAKVEIKKHYTIVVASVLGAIAIASVTLVLRHWSQIHDWAIDMGQLMWAQ